MAAAIKEIGDLPTVVRRRPTNPIYRAERSADRRGELV